MDISSSSQGEDNELQYSDANDHLDVNYYTEISQPSRIRGKQKFFDDRMLACMDKCNISTRDAIHFISATVNALGHKVEDLVLNRTAIQLMRKEYRRRQAKQIIDNFNVNN